MALYKKAQIPFSMQGITFEGAGTQGERAVILFLTQYAQYRYVLVVCTNQGPDDATPPEVLLRVKVPDDGVTFTFTESNLTVIVTRGDANSCISFRYPADFWEINRIVSKAKQVNAVNELVIDALVKDAIKNIPRGLRSSVAADVQVAEDELDAQSEGTSEGEGGFATAVEDAELVEAELAVASGIHHVAGSEAGAGAQ